MRAASHTSLKKKFAGSPGRWTGPPAGHKSDFQLTDSQRAGNGGDRKLEAISSIKASRVDYYANIIEGQIETLSASQGTLEAMEGFKQAYFAFPWEANADGNIETLRRARRLLP